MSIPQVFEQSQFLFLSIVRFDVYLTLRTSNSSAVLALGEAWERTPVFDFATVLLDKTGSEI